MESNTNPPAPKFHISAAGSSLVALAQRLYAAYTENSGNLNYRGEQCPAWDDLGDAVRSHWCATAARSLTFEFRDIAHPKVGNWCQHCGASDLVGAAHGKPPTMIAKFEVFGSHRNLHEDGSTASVQLSMTAAVGPNNETWAKMTPCGQLSMTITNPQLFGELADTSGYFLVSFTKSDS